jgi:hypothetical protein
MHNLLHSLSWYRGVSLYLSRNCELEYNDAYARVHSIACNCMPCLWSFLMHLVGYHLIQNKKQKFENCSVIDQLTLKYCTNQVQTMNLRAFNADIAHECSQLVLNLIAGKSVKRIEWLCRRHERGRLYFWRTRSDRSRAYHHRRSTVHARCTGNERCTKRAA